MDPAIKKRLNRKCHHGKYERWCKECGGSGICSHGKRKDVCADCQNFVCPVPACEGRRLSSARNLQGHIDFWHSNKCRHMKPFCYYGGFCRDCTECQKTGRRDPRCLSLAEAGVDVGIANS